MTSTGDIWSRIDGSKPHTSVVGGSIPSGKMRVKDFLWNIVPHCGTQPAGAGGSGKPESDRLGFRNQLEKKTALLRGPSLTVDRYPSFWEKSLLARCKASLKNLFLSDVIRCLNIERLIAATIRAE